MTRLRWFTLALGQGDIGTVASAMLADEFNAKRRWGFHIDTVRKSSIAGAFIEQVDVVDEVADPFGKKLEFPRTEFRRVTFRIATEAPGLEVRDPPRSTRAFFSQLATYLEFKVAIEPVRTPVQAWIEELEREAGKVRVQLAEFSGVPVSEATAARVIFEGTEDVRPRVDEFLGRRAVRTLERAVAVTGKGTFDLYRDGRATILAGGVDGGLAVLRNALRNHEQ